MKTILYLFAAIVLLSASGCVVDEHHDHDPNHPGEHWEHDHWEHDHPDHP